MRRAPKLVGISSLLGVAVAALVLGPGAAGSTATSSPKVRHTSGGIEALAIDGSRIAYDVGPQGVANKVVVWNVRTGKTTTVSGKHTRRADSSSTGSGVFELAIAGSRVAWVLNLGGNTEGDDYLFTSSVTTPKERQVATVQRLGDTCPGRAPRCAGPWLGGLAGSGNLLVVNRWTTNENGDVADGALYLLSGTKMTSVAGGAGTVEAASTDGGRVAVLRLNGGIAVYSSAGKLLLAEPLLPDIEAIALSGHGHKLATLTTTGQLEFWDYRTPGSRKSFPTHGRLPATNLDVQGNLAIYTTGPALHAVNLSSGKDRVIGTLRGSVAFARISAAGVVYSTGRSRSKGTLVFLPFARVAAAVS